MLVERYGLIDERTLRRTAAKLRIPAQRASPEREADLFSLNAEEQPPP